MAFIHKRRTTLSQRHRYRLSHRGSLSIRKELSKILNGKP